jgi:hypothetical protein
MIPERVKARVVDVKNGSPNRLAPRNGFCYLSNADTFGKNV